MRRLALAFLLPAAACAPQNATMVSGDFTAFLGASSSITLSKGLVNVDDFALRTALDCRDFADVGAAGDEELRLGNGPGTERDQRLPICAGDRKEGGGRVTDAEWPPVHEAWMTRDGFVVVGDSLDPWRGEAVITSEGDAQITFHQRLPGGEDFWFAFVVDPDFGPHQCVQTGNGDGVSFEPVDGDWIANWSSDLADGSTLYFLNSGSYQFDPEGVAAYNFQDPNADVPFQWSIPNEWAAGYASGNFADDLLLARSDRFGSPAVYAALENPSEDGGNPRITTADIYYCPTFTAASCVTDEAMANHKACVEAAEAIVDPDAQDAALDACESTISQCYNSGLERYANYGNCVDDLAECTVDDGADCRATFDACIATRYDNCVTANYDRAVVASTEVGVELGRAGLPFDEATAGDLPTFGMHVHDNAWRTPSGGPAGIDGWTEGVYSWVKFDAGSELEAGGAASGEFSIVLDPQQTTSRVFVRGRFEVKRWKKDLWGTEFLPPKKFEQNGTTLCGANPADYK